MCVPYCGVSKNYNTVVGQCKDSTPLLKPTIEHSSEPVPSTCHPHTTSPLD